MNLNQKGKLDIYRTIIRIRAFENAARILVKTGEIPTRLEFYTGQEAVAAGVCAHLGPSDQIGSTHRALGHLIAKGCNLKHLMAELCAKKTGLNKGKGGPYHVFDPLVGALGANGIVGGSVPLVAGYALTHQILADRGLGVSFFGEGASNQGGVQETLNLAACWGLPLVFVCENSSFEVQRMLGHEIDYPQLSIKNVSDRAKAYNIPGSTHDGLDAIEVYEATSEAIQRARKGKGPSLLEFKVRKIEGNLEGRLEAHDDEKIWCPIHKLEERLTKENILDPNIAEKIKKEEKVNVESAIKFALQSPFPEPLDAFNDIFYGDGVND